MHVGQASSHRFRLSTVNQVTSRPRVESRPNQEDTPERRNPRLLLPLAFIPYQSTAVISDGSPPLSALSTGELPHELYGSRFELYGGNANDVLWEFG